VASTGSALVAVIAVVGAVSVSVVATAALLLSCEVLRSSLATGGVELPGSLERFYWRTLSPLVHRPFRRLLLRAGVALVIVIAPAIRLLW
jgi:hypothetical protein